MFLVNKYLQIITLLILMLKSVSCDELKHGNEVTLATSSPRGSELTFKSNLSAHIMLTSNVVAGKQYDFSVVQPLTVTRDGSISPSGKCQTKIAPPSAQNIISRFCGVKKKAKSQRCFQSESAFCNCIGGLADCSGKPHIPNIAYVPKLPANVSCLYFKNNNVKFLTDSYFANVSNIRVLDLSSNSLTTISPLTFKIFSSLEYLILNDNSLTDEMLRNVLSFPPALRLDLIGVHLSNMSIFNEPSDVKTKQLVTDYNFLPQLDFHYLSKLKGLETFACRCCNINSLLSADIQSLKFLDLRYNKISAFPQTCRNKSQIIAHGDHIGSTKDSIESIETFVSEKNTKVAYYPSLSQLFLDSNSIGELPETSSLCLDKMNVMSLAENSISRVPEMFFASMTKLSRLDFRKMSVPVTVIGNCSFGAPSLSTLYLNKNNISFESQNISRSLFLGANRLGDLFIDHNLIGSASETILKEILNYTIKLTHLYLSDADLTFVPVTAFSQLKNLKSLYLYNNKIQTLPDGAFDALTSLTRLSLQNNLISVVKEGAFSPETISRLVELDLSSNKFLCNCDLLWFQKWLTTNGSHLFDNINKYICSDRLNVRVQDYIENQQACLMSRSTYIIFVVCLSICVFVFLMFTLVFRYRWNIRLMLYERRASSRDMARMQGEFKFDLFIIYCKDDSEWVEKDLLFVIEKTWHLKCCIHARDFVAGGLILDNMVDCINSSKRLLVVVSSSFVHSSWCRFELMLCQSHIISHDLPSLLVIQMDKIEARDMNSAMYALYNTCSFLEFPDHRDFPGRNDLRQQMQTFWSRLHRSLQSLMPPNKKADFGTQTSVTIQGREATQPSPNRNQLLRQMSEQSPRCYIGSNTRNLRRMHSEMPGQVSTSGNPRTWRDNQRERTPLIESEELSEETSVMHV